MESGEKNGMCLDTPDIRDYTLIPFTGKLKLITGRKHTPNKLIHVRCANKDVAIQVFFLEEERKVFVNQMMYDQYQEGIEKYFISDMRDSTVISKNEIKAGRSNTSFLDDEKQKILKEKDNINENIENESGSEKKNLKNYLLSDFGDYDFKRKSIIEIYCYDRNHYESLQRKKKIKREAVEFLDYSCLLLEEAQKIPTEAFRRLKYEEIVDDYIQKHGIDKKAISVVATEKKDELVKNTDSISSQSKLTSSSDFSLNHKDIEKKEDTEKKLFQNIPLHCVFDYNILEKYDEKKVHNKKDRSRSFIIPMLKCPHCNHLYTSIPEYRDLMKIKLADKTYTNINVGADLKRYSSYISRPMQIVPGCNCYVYNSAKPKQCRKCSRTGLMKKEVRSSKSVKYSTLYCPYCNVHYLKYGIYKDRSAEWNLLNPEEFQSFKIEREKTAAERKKLKAERKAAEKARKLLLQQELKQKKQDALLRKQELKEKQERAKKLREENQRLLQKQYDQQVKKYLSDNKESKSNHDNNIRVKDFVVRRTTFKCMHEGHALRNIDGIIQIINDKGEIIQSKVTAGYCPNCNVFFIMESTYQRLKMKGTPICRISDEKTYMKNSINANGMRLAQESILMQYGYNVSQQEGLTGSRRRKILAVLIDNNVLTRTDIISYLDFFINQRKNQHKYEKAIEKWEDDREFVAEYKTGAYTQYGISGISRKY